LDLKVNWLLGSPFKKYPIKHHGYHPGQASLKMKKGGKEMGDDDNGEGESTGSLP